VMENRRHDASEYAHGRLLLRLPGFAGIIFRHTDRLMIAIAGYQRNDEGAVTAASCIILFNSSVPA
jgi:hypothetical protein